MTMRIITAFLALCFSILACGQQIQIPKTTFQTNHLWRPGSDFGTEAVLVYDVNDIDGKDFESRIKTWKIHGYEPQFMISFSWGEDLNHKFKWQTLLSGHPRMHGEVPYFIPDEKYCKDIFNRKIKRAINADIHCIVFEEPEFYINCNPELSDSNKCEILLQTLQYIIALTKQYAHDQRKDVYCLIATHSIFNYANWGIISPEILLSKIPQLDGFIGQVWQDTAESSNDSLTTFEHAYLEYASLAALINSNNKILYFLTDPVGDIDKSWCEYKDGYLATTVAMMMIGNINRYEILPWPHRILEYRHPLNKLSTKPVKIPEDYLSLILIINQILRTTPTVADKDTCNILISNEIMNSDGKGNKRIHIIERLYQQLLPIVRKGVPIRFIYKEDSTSIKRNNGYIYMPEILSQTNYQNITNTINNLGIIKKNYYKTQRGNYIFTYAISDNGSAKRDVILRGKFIDILDDKLKVTSSKTVKAGNVSILYDLSSIKSSKPIILVTGTKDIIKENSDSAFIFFAYGPDKSINKQKIFLPKAPENIMIFNHDGTKISFEQNYDRRNHLLYLSFPNNHLGCRITINL